MAAVNSSLLIRSWSLGMGEALDAEGDVFDGEARIGDRRGVTFEEVVTPCTGSNISGKDKRA